jgi:hypothetical protein
LHVHVIEEEVHEGKVKNSKIKKIYGEKMEKKEKKKNNLIVG